MKKHLTKSYKPSAHEYSFEITVLAVLCIWVAYRLFGVFPDWIDEIFVKGIVFGIPAWYFIRQRRKDVGLTYGKLFPGLFLGLAVGGLFGFSGVLASLSRGTQIQPFNLFLSPIFLNLFFLSLWTSWWESVFFFGFIQNAIQDRIKKSSISLFIVTTLTALVFTVFHAPIQFVHAGVTVQSLRILLLLFVFALGQSLFYSRTKNIYALVLSYTFWGIVLALYAF